MCTALQAAAAERRQSGGGVQACDGSLALAVHRPSIWVWKRVLPGRPGSSPREGRQKREQHEERWGPHGRSKDAQSLQDALRKRAARWRSGAQSSHGRSAGPHGGSIRRPSALALCRPPELHPLLSPVRCAAASRGSASPATSAHPLCPPSLPTPAPTLVAAAAPRAQRDHVGRLHGGATEAHAASTARCRQARPCSGVHTPLYAAVFLAAAEPAAASDGQRQTGQHPSQACER